MLKFVRELHLLFADSARLDLYPSLDVNAGIDDGAVADVNIPSAGGATEMRGSRGVRIVTNGPVLTNSGNRSDSSSAGHSLSSRGTGPLRFDCFCSVFRSL
jgi:hypothetical protein